MKNSKILVIEDTQSIKEELKDILGFEGMEVITAENGQEGIDRAKEYNPDLILCDIMMPIKDGYQVFNEIQHDVVLKDTPFLFLTAKATINNRRRGMILGVDDYITKPFDIDLLINSIKIRLAKAANRKSLEKEKRETLQNNISKVIPHELLTPLDGIIGVSSIMKEYATDMSPEEIQQFSEAILESGNRLYDTIKKFIYHTEVELLLNDESKKDLLQSEIIEFGALMLSNQCEQVATKHNRLSDLKINPNIFNAKISLSHFEIIISNIVDNAFKFSKKGDAVRIEVVTDETFVHISVCDEGIGIDGITKKNIEVFTQFNRDKMEQQGLGLGLITAIKLLEFYKGEIRFLSNKEKGGCVKLSFLLAD
ncbi:hybrid sensor histidine kinase/response regulator [Polaribacter sp.]|jgi:two-component system sensor kinase|uniref:hybrid sensor histidine kinase/response regulator n=1 Tax=Polaribacter sp. TaxID=1920175 RepID=UPI003ACE9109